MKHTWMRKLANVILVIGIVVTMVGAVYIAVMQNGYAIAACFTASAVLMTFLLCSRKR